MARANTENQKRMDAAAAQGWTIGTVYKVVANEFGKGSQTVYCDAGLFVTRQGVPGAYFLADTKPA